MVKIIITKKIERQDYKRKKISIGQDYKRKNGAGGCEEEYLKNGTQKQLCVAWDWTKISCVSVLAQTI